MQEMPNSTSKRDLAQLDAIKAWVNNNKKGTVVLSTGFGKTKVGVMIAGTQLRKEKIQSVLILVPNIPLISQWRAQFKLWGYDDTNVDIKCIKGVYNKSFTYDLLIIDEIHTSLSTEYSKLFTNIKYEQILGLTATLPHRQDHKTILDKHCPVIFTKTVKEALEAEAISDFKVYNVAVSLSKKDAALYRLYNGKWLQAQSEILAYKKTQGIDDLSTFDIARIYSKNKEKDRINIVSRSYWSAMTMRKYVCYNSSSKINVVLEIIRNFPDRKWIIFTKTIKYATALNRILLKSSLYHSYLSKVDRESVLHDFSNNKTKILIAVDALNAGLDVPDADAGICVSGVSTELVATQQLGRISRVAKNKLALMFNLYSTNTVEKGWVESKTINFNPTWINANEISKFTK